MFPSVKLDQSWMELETDIQHFWEKENIFEQSLVQREESPVFSFFEGPPTANGKPGIHHVLARIYKDLVCRYKTMKGFLVPRKGGWDTHGLPVELEVEKKLHISGKQQIEAYGMDKFIEACKQSIFTYKEEWDRITRRIGYWLDLENPYITCTNEYIESVWWALKEIFQKGLLVKGHKVVPHCPRCQTTLSSHEVAQGYQDNTEDPSVYVKFPLNGKENTYLIVWTTTPWTLPANVALAINENASYCRIKVLDEEWILAEARVPVVCEKLEYTIMETFPGKQLIHQTYIPLYPFFKLEKEAYYVISANFVGLEEGTGIVHIAPSFGLDDMEAGLQYDLPVLLTVNIDGTFRDIVEPYRGMFVKDADKLIIKELKTRNLLVKSGTIRHTYPFCWRCHSPLLYMAKDSWFIKVSSIRDELLAENEKIEWLPAHIKKGRFGEWLKDAKDWAISRERYWGTPLPLWECESCHQIVAIGGKEDLQRYLAKDQSVPEDLHRPYIDQVNLICPFCQYPMRRVKDVVDCWLDSGSMPFAQYHYPFENQSTFQSRFPAQFISEGIDQTRGWFYTLLVMNYLLFSRSPYQNCLTFELVLDEKGEKMSKSRGNVVNVDEVLLESGADAIRWSMFFSSTPYVPRRFSKQMVMDAYKNFILPWRNVLSFFVTYANIDQWTPSGKSLEKQQVTNSLDLWILSRLNSTICSMTSSLDAYEMNAASKVMYAFLDEVTNWYVRRSRRRFWKNEPDSDKSTAYAVLYHVLLTVSRLIAPFTPFMAEYMHQTLSFSPQELKTSVHLEDFPRVDETWIDLPLEESISFTRELVSALLRLRKQVGIKARFPLSKAGWIPKKPVNLTEEMKSSIMEEVNLKSLYAFSETKSYLQFEIKPNLPVLGKKYSQLIPQIKTTLQNLEDPNQWVQTLKETGHQTILVNHETVHLVNEDILTNVAGVGDWVAAEIDEAYVVLNKSQSDALIQEGIVREIIHAIQNERKNKQFSVTDRIRIQWNAVGSKTRQAVYHYTQEIQKEVLAETIELDETIDRETAQTIELPNQYDDFTFTICLFGSTGEFSGLQ